MNRDATFHQQLIEKLRALIRDRPHPPGTRFFTERDIARRYKTSRPTANKVLSSLVAEGVLEFRKGVGTFVRESVLDYDLQRLVSFTDKAKAAGRMPGTRVIGFRKLKAADAMPEVIRALHASGEDALLYIERVRLADGQPVIHECRHVVAHHCKSLTRTDAKGSLYAAWTGRCKLSITGADESIRAVNATRAQARMLGIPPETACLLVVATGFIEGDTPLWHEETLYRADVYEFRNRLGGVAAPRPALGRLRSVDLPHLPARTNSSSLSTPSLLVSKVGKRRRPSASSGNL